jgi:arginine N-succinyltransferase
MMLVRPVSLNDLDPLIELAGQAGVGLTTLPSDRDLLRRRILKSQRSMENIPDRPGGESYLFVMQEVESGKIVGASGIVSKVGGFEPFYAYRIEKTPLKSELLKVNKEIATLHLVREHDGPAEIGSLFLAPDYRKKDNGRFLQLVRFLFMAEHRDAFEPQVVSEMRGVIDESGHSAFWEAVGKHFFQIDFRQADHLSVVNKKFIADLMPKHPIYVDLLPEAAQQVIGQVHPQSKPALKNLQAEGFGFSGMVDIFDAGACIRCGRDEIRTIRESATAAIAEISDATFDSATFMMATVDQEFRACMGPVAKTSAGIRINGACAQVLGVSAGQRICFSPLRSAASAGEST